MGMEGGVVSLPAKRSYGYQEDEHCPDCQCQQGKTRKGRAVGQRCLQGLRKRSSRKDLRDCGQRAREVAQRQDPAAEQQEEQEKSLCSRHRYFGPECPCPS